MTTITEAFSISLQYQPSVIASKKEPTLACASASGRRLKLTLTAEQSAALAPQLISGRALLGRVTREVFTGTNAETAGRLIIELGAVPETALPALREAIAKANRPKPAKKGKGTDCPTCPTE
jgi:hypothetical protein